MPIGELRYIDDIRHHLGTQSEFAKHVNQIPGRHHQPVRSAQQRPCGTETAKVIPGLPAVIMNQDFLFP